MAEMPNLKRKYGFQLKPEQMLYMQQMRPRSGGQIATDIISQSSPDLKPAPGNFFQRASEGARIAGELVNKYAPKVYEKIPQKVTSLAPFGFVGLNQGFQDLLSQSRKDVINTEVPTSLKIIPSIDTATGEMQPAGFGKGRTTVGKVVEAIKPADLLGITGAQKTYSALGYGQAPEPMDVLDTLGLQAGMYQAGRAGFKGASTLAKAGAPYAAEGLTNLVSKYGVDPRMNILPDAPSMSEAVPEGFKLGQEDGKFVLFDASGKIFAKGDDAKSAIFRANKRLENEAANAARTARREERAAAAPAAEEKPLVKVDTDDQAPLFYNPLAKAAANLGEDTDPLKVLNDLKSFDNVTDDQITFSGIADYLERKAEKNLPVTREEVQGFIDENRIKLYEHLRDGNSGRYEPDDLEIASHRMQTEDPDDDYLRDIADNEEEYVRDNYYDEIYNDIRESYPDLDEERIQEKVDLEISDRAWELARDYYYENPVESGTNDAGYQIIGNREQGYSVIAPNGRRIDTFDDVDDANQAILDHAVDQGLVGDPNSRTLFGEKQYPAYMMPGGRNYRELNIGLQPGSKDKTAGKIKLYDQYIDNLQEEANAIRQQYPIIRERPDDVTQRLEDIGNRIQVAEDLKRANKESSEAWYGGHFEDEPDLFAQLRLQDYQDVDGMSGTLIDEAQSDMHQKGREKGYRAPKKELEAKKIEHGTLLNNFQQASTNIPSLRVYPSYTQLINDMAEGEQHFFEAFRDRIVRHNKMPDLDNPDQPVQEVYLPMGSELTEVKRLIDEAKKLKEGSKEIQKMEYGIPDAPFKKDWYHVAIRRAIKDAIDNGKDRVYLPTGEALADRYNYAAAIDQIAYKVRSNGKYSVTLKDFDGNWHQTIGNQSFSNLDADELDGIFGKAMADKIRNKNADQINKSQLDPNDTTYLIENQNIDVGGKGFKKYYDEIYPNFMKKEAKEFDAKTGYTKIPTPVRHPKQVEKLIRSAARRNRVSVAEMQQRMRNWSQSQQDDFFNNRQEPVFYIEINDAMREAYGKGRPYARGGLVTDALDAVEEHFQKGGKVPAKNESEAKNIEPVPLLGRLAGMLGESSEFLKSRPLKEEGSWQARGAASAVNSVLELVDQFLVGDLAKTADRMAYGFPVTSGKGETLKPLPETTGAVLTVAPPAVKLASKTARVVKNAAPLMEQATKQGAETVFDMLERYAPQPMYVVPPGKRMSRAEAEAAGLWHPISNEKLSRPYSEMTSTTVDNPAVIMPTRKVLTPEDLYKKAGFPLIGDRAATGKILTHINDQPLAWPVPLTGGPEYMMANLAKKPGQSAAWESGKGKVTALQNRIEEAVKQNPDDVVGVYSSGSLQQGDFNTMMSDALAAQLKSSKISKQAAEEFNADVRNFFPEFVGINSKKLRDQLLDLKNGVLRTAFVKRMAQENFQKKGFPDVASTRKAIMEPAILEDPIGTTGFTVASMDKNRRIVTPQNPSGYPLAMSGEYIGGFETRLPHDIMFSSKAKQRRLLGADPAGDYRSYELAQPVQMFDQEWLDTVGKYLEQRKKLTGKKEGGVVGTVYSPKENLVFVGQEHGKAADLPEGIREIAEKYGAYYEGSGGDKTPEMGYRGSWDDAAAKSVEGYPEEFLYTLFTNTDVNRQQDALKGKGSIFDSILKNQKKFGYFKDKAFDADTLRSFLSKMGDDVLSRSQMDASEENIRDFLSMGESLMWDRDDTEARRMADKANSFRQDWLLSQPSGVFFVGSDHIQDLKQKAQPVKKSQGGPADDPPPLPRNAGEVEEWRRKSKVYEDRQYWKRRGPNSADEDDSPRRLEEQRSYPMRWQIPQQRNRQMMPEVREEDLPFKRALRYYGKGGNVEGIKITETYSIAPEAKRQKLSKAEEAAFQRDVRRTKWFQQFSKKYGEPPNLNDPGYNYRAAWRAGLRPQDVKDDPEMQHWSSVTPSGESLKSRSHPTAWKEDYMQMTGRDPGDPGTLTPEQIEGMKRALMYRYSGK